MDDVLGGAKFLLGVGIDAGVGSAEIPNSGKLPDRCARLRGAARAVSSNKHLGTLIWERIVELAAKQHAVVFRIESKVEFRSAGGFAAVVSVGRVDFPASERIHAPYVARS